MMWNTKCLQELHCPVARKLQSQRLCPHVCTGYPCQGEQEQAAQWLSDHLWRHLEDVQVWHVETWLNGELGSVWFAAGLDALRDHF